MCESATRLRKSVIRESDGLTSEYSFHVDEINSVFTDIRPPLRFVPFKTHNQCSYKL
jgi:hypothetical protein